MKHFGKCALVFLVLSLWGGPLLADSSGKDVLASSHVAERLLAQTGVHDRPATAVTPDFVFDPAWPQRLPHNWILGAVVGIFVDRHDHVWVYQRPRDLSYDESGLDGAVPGATDAKGVPVNGLGYARPHGPVADCCRSAPSVLEFDTAGKLLRAWGGPSDPGFIGGKCKPTAGCIWPNSEHGIYVDDKDNVWLGGNGDPVTKPIPWTTHKTGGDGTLLKFDRDGNFKLGIGGTPDGPVSNDTKGGFGGTPLMYEPADMVIDRATNRMFIADGYGNRRILIINPDTGKYIGHFTAYGNSPVDDKAITDSGFWVPDARPKSGPAFFRSPVHCVTLAQDGKLYVCDRGNDRIQIFDKDAPDLGKSCSNPTGQVGKCGYLGEQWISPHTEAAGEVGLPGTAVFVNFSKDKAQSCLYVGDDTNQTIYILGRGNLQQLGRLGKLSQTPGDFRWMHQIAVDSEGNLYTSEAGIGSRVQKFLRYGAAGCSGTGSATVGGPLP